MNKEMEVSSVVVVGNRFRDFAAVENVMTVSDFEKRLHNIREQNQSIHVTIGQGVTPESKVMLQNLVRQLSIDIQIAPGVDQEDRVFVHKHCQENVLISTPQRIEKDRFQCSLVIDERCADMQDHVTGQHLQGMLLTESVRQTMTSVVEHFYLEERTRGKMRFILDGIHSEFKQFAFPVDITIVFQVIKMRHVPNLGFKASAEVVFSQYSRELASAKIDFSVLDRTFVSQIERRALQDTMKQVFQAARSPDTVINLG